jgi:hypothetical protein
MTKCLFDAHQKIPLVSLNQKAFIPGIAGCAEHAGKANSIITNANRNGRTLFMVALDLKDAFGSIPHQIIKKNMKDIGIPDSITEFISDTYHQARTRIFAGKSKSQAIRTNKGVKQGCPLSPLLFDLAIDPLLKAVESLHREDGYSMLIGSENIVTSIQAYADDILLFSESKEGMDNILKTVELFGEYANIRLNPKKCQAFYKCGRNEREGEAPENIKIYGEDLEYVNINEVIKYLGTPVGARKNAKLNFAESKVESFRKHLNRIMDSGLKISQKINAIKTFIAPQLDFTLMNGQIRVDDVERLDREVRKVINKAVGGPPLPIDFFYSNWKDGGASLICLEERKEVMTIANLAHLLTSFDVKTREWVMNDIAEEVLKRNITTTEYNQRFLNWMDDREFHLDSNGVRYDSLIFRAYKASKKLKVGFKYIEEDNKVEITDYRRQMSQNNEDEDDEEEEVTTNSFLSKGKQVACSLMQILQARHQKLQSLALRGHTFHSLEKSPCSNFFICNCKASTSDGIVKFAIRARTNSLSTRVILKKARRVRDDCCLMCTRRQPETLQHVLNGCRKRFQKMTYRHNQICKILAQAILKHQHRPIIKYNSTIILPQKRQRLPEDTRILKPDIWFEREGELFIIEVTIPYGSKTRYKKHTEEEDESLEELSAIEVRRMEKERKYRKLVEDCQYIFDIKVHFFVIIMSSLRAIPSFTCTDLSKLLKCQKSMLLLWLKRLPVEAIRVSLFLFYNFAPKRTNDEIPTAIDEEDETTEDPEEQVLQNDLHTQVLQKINEDIEDENENRAYKRNQEDQEEVFVIEENLDVDRDHIIEKQLTDDEFETDESDEEEPEDNFGQVINDNVNGDFNEGNLTEEQNEEEAPDEYFEEIDAATEDVLFVQKQQRRETPVVNFNEAIDDEENQEFQGDHSVMEQLNDGELEEEDIDQVISAPIDRGKLAQQ